MKQKRLAKNAPAPCVVRRRSSETASTDSLAKNIRRDALHLFDRANNLHSNESQARL